MTPLPHDDGSPGRKRAGIAAAFAIVLLLVVVCAIVWPHRAVRSPVREANDLPCHPQLAPRPSTSLGVSAPTFALRATADRSLRQLATRNPNLATRNSQTATRPPLTRRTYAPPRKLAGDPRWKPALETPSQSDRERTAAAHVIPLKRSAFGRGAPPPNPKRNQTQQYEAQKQHTKSNAAGSTNSIRPAADHTTGAPDRTSPPSRPIASSGGHKFAPKPAMPGMVKDAAGNQPALNPPNTSGEDNGNASTPTSDSNPNSDDIATADPNAPNPQSPAALPAGPAPMPDPVQAVTQPPSVSSPNDHVTTLDPPVVPNNGGETPRDAPPADPNEPNETYGAATAISPGMYNKTIHTEGDVDWYAVAIASDETDLMLNVELTFPGGGGDKDLELSLYDSDGTTEKNRSATGDPMESAAMIVSAGTTYYIRVWGWGSSTNTYTMEVQLLGPDGFEPNNADTAAAQVNLDTLYPNLNIGGGGDAGDVDWYKFDVPEGGLEYVSIQIVFHPGNHPLHATNGTFGHDLELHVYSGTPGSLTEIAKGTTGSPNESAGIKDLAEGTYYIYVWGWDVSLNVYDLQISTAAPGAVLQVELEPGFTSLPYNDARIEATIRDNMNLDPAQTVAWETSPVTTDPLGLGQWTLQITIRDASGEVESQFLDTLFVLEYGQTALFLCGSFISGYRSAAYAVSGNHSTNIIRSEDDTWHATWLDMSTSIIWYMRGVRTPGDASGRITWDRDSLTEISENSVVNSDAYPTLAVTPGQNILHFAWEYGDRVRYRRWPKGTGGWDEGDLGTIVDTGFSSGSTNENSADLCVDVHGIVHLVASRKLNYAYSLDGTTWHKEYLDAMRPSGNVKYPAMAVDSMGGVHIVFTNSLLSAWPPRKGGHWICRYFHRLPPFYVYPEDAGNRLDSYTALATGDPYWIENLSTNEGFPEWADKTTPDDDVVLDWIDLFIDGWDHIHLAWHGTAVSWGAAFDDTFYQRRTSVAPGTYKKGSWERPQTIYDGSGGAYYPPVGEYSFCPGVVADKSGISVSVIMYKADAVGPWNPPTEEDFPDLALAMRVFYQGKPVEGSFQDIVRYTRPSNDGMATWWPTIAPRFQTHESKQWMDLVCGAKLSPSDHRGVVIHRRVDMTSYFDDAASGAIVAERYDYGDAPWHYRTGLDRDGPRHVATGPYLGSARDVERDGRPTPTANGDDIDPAGDDEDGVAGLDGGITPDTNASITVTVSGATELFAWVDFNGDEDFDDAGEQVFAGTALVAGDNALQFAVPAGATVGPTFARFRVCTVSGLGSYGKASDGEVEDYPVTIVAP